MHRKIRFRHLLATLLCVSVTAASAGELPLVDALIHYSHDAWQRMPPPEAVKVLRSAGLKRTFVSSSSDEGTQKLYKIAPDLIGPELRPYRKRGEISTWMYDETVVSMPIDMAASSRSGSIPITCSANTTIAIQRTMP